MKPKIVCLCGSTRFYETFQRANYEETMAGKIVLSVGFYRPSPESQSERVRYKGTHGESWGCTPAQKLALDELHKRKIDIADEVLVLNVGGYIGESTRSEIIYAQDHGKPVRWLETPTCMIMPGSAGLAGAGDESEPTLETIAWAESKLCPPNK
jgi:hypothetical protein